MGNARRSLRSRALGALLALGAPCLAPPASAQVEAQLWTFSVSLRESFTDNLFLSTVAVAEQQEFVTAATLSLSYNRLRRGSSLGAFAWANGQIFARLDGYNQGQFGLGLAGRKDINHRLKWRYRGSYGDGINLDVLYGGGGPGLPQVDVKSGYLSTGTTFALTPRTSWDVSLDGSYFRYRSRLTVDTAALPFDTLAPPEVIGATRPQPLDPTVLVLPDGTEILRLLSGESIVAQRLDYWSWRPGTGLSVAFSPKTRMNLGLGYNFGRQSPRTFRGGGMFDTSLGFARALSTKSNLGGGYTFQQSDYGLRSQTHSVSLQADREFSDRWKGDITLGTTYYDGSTPQSSGWTWIGGLGATVKLDRSGLSGRYSRTMYQGQIVPSLQISDSFSLGGGHIFTKRVFGSLFGYYLTTSDQINPRLSYDSAFLSAALSVRFAKRLTGGLSYAFQHFDDGVFASANRSYFTVSFGYTRNWK